MDGFAGAALIGAFQTIPFILICFVPVPLYCTVIVFSKGPSAAALKPTFTDVDLPAATGLLLHSGVVHPQVV